MKSVLFFASLALGLAAPAMAAGPDGATIFKQRCAACHTVEPAGANKLGPNVACTVGRTAGTHEGFNYSPAMAKSGITWTADNLDAFLAKPRAFMPGNKMIFAGLSDPGQRERLVSILTCKEKK